MPSLTNVPDLIPPLSKPSIDRRWNKMVKDFSKKFRKAEADHKKYLMAALSSANSLRQVKKILSEKGELSEDMKDVFDRAIFKEEEQKKPTGVPIQRIVEKIQIMKKFERQDEVKQLFEKKEAEIDYKQSEIDKPNELTSREAIDRRLAVLREGLGEYQDLLIECQYLSAELHPIDYQSLKKLERAQSWPDYPEFYESDTQAEMEFLASSDLDENSFEE